MNLGKQLTERLALLGDESGRRERAVLVESKGVAYYSIGTWLGPLRAVLEFGDHDRYSVTLRALEVGCALAPNGHQHDWMPALAATIAGRLSYLEEPLAVWELSQAEGMAQLRSAPPQREGDAICYWELLLRTGEQVSVRLSRYRWQPTLTERALIEYPATFSLLGRIATDIASCIE